MSKVLYFSIGAAILAAVVVAPMSNEVIATGYERMTDMIESSLHPLPVENAALSAQLQATAALSDTVPATNTATTESATATSTPTATAPTSSATTTTTVPLAIVIPATATAASVLTQEVSDQQEASDQTTLPQATPLLTETAGADTVVTDTVVTDTLDLSEPSSTATQTADGPLVGTIVANRSNSDARFFVEGQTYRLAPQRAEGLNLPRDTAVLNLYNCDADTPETQQGCFWDPYLLRRDGFFEIYERPTNDGEPALLLREAGAPPTDQVWVQNRTGSVESLVFRNEVVEIQPSSVKEFPVATGVPAILYVRSCITANDQTVCEWSPKTLDAGMYYAMVDIEMPGSLPESLITTIDLRPVVGGGSEEPVASTGMECVLQVPALNVRSGPGLQYEIIAKVRGTDTEPGTVLVIGRSPDSQWLAVDGRVAPGGWITGSTSYIRCTGDTASLPLMEVPQPQVAQLVTEPTAPVVAVAPEPVVQTAAPEPADVTTATVVTEPPAETAPEPTATQATIPPGQAMLLINNGFQFEIRFTVDQIYRPVQGPSEYDLQPGESLSLLVNPGTVAFTVSSPWNGLSGNSTLTIEPDQALTLWVRFEPDPGESDLWNLVWQ